jgi:enoyl-CoA hydratase/carnithine racemase
VRELPWAIAARLVLGGDPVNAEEALRFGLINGVVAREDLQAEAQRWATKLCSRGPLALRAAKRAMQEGRDLPIDEGLAIEQKLFNSLAYTSDLREGLAAFKEKRAPGFRGE